MYIQKIETQSARCGFVWIVVVEDTEEMTNLIPRNAGLCLACGHDVMEVVEPAARRLRCEACGESEVYGLAALRVMGRVRLGGNGDGACNSHSGPSPARKFATSASASR